MERQTLAIGTYLKGDEYEVIRILGQGGFGITYECRQRGLNRSVAVKEFFMKDIQYRNDDGSISSATESQRSIASQHLAKFKKEAQTIAQMGDAQHVVKVFDIFDENNTTYYVMELIDGCNLADYVKAHGPMNELRAFSLGLQVAQALRFMHEHHTMHLDVKPANVLLRKQTSEDDNAVLIDFGLAKHYDQKGDETTATPVGISAGYAPMEQYSDGGVSHFTPTIDIYSLGATLYFLCTGHRPADAGTLVSQPMQKPAAMSNEAWQVISKAMEKAPQSRFANMQEMIWAIEHVCQYLNETTETKPKKKQPASRKNNAWMLIALVALLAGIVGLLCLSRCKGDTKAIEDDEEVKVHFQRKNDGAFGFVNGEGEIQEQLGSWTDARNFCDGLAYVTEKNNGVVHPYYIDRYGQKQITLEPDMIGYDFKDGRARVIKGNKWGIIDTTGRYVLECRWKEVAYCEQDCVFVVADFNGNKGVIDLDGNWLLPCKYMNIFSVKEQLAIFQKEGSARYGYMTLDGDEVIPIRFVQVRPFSEGLAAVWDEVNVNDNVKVKKCGFIDKNGQVVIPFVWDAGGDFVNGRAIVRDGNKFKIIDRDNNVLCEVRGLDIRNKEYFSSFDIQEGRAKVKSQASEPNLYGIIDYEGRLLADLKYKSIGWRYKNGLIWATDKAGKVGYLDVNGNVAIDFVYEGASDFDEDGQAWVCKDGLWKLISY